MAGPTKHNPSEKVYVTDGTLKSTREKLDDFKRFLQVSKFKNVDSSGNPFEPPTPEEEWFDSYELSERNILAAIDKIRETIEMMETLPDWDRNDDWFEEMENAKKELELWEYRLANRDKINREPFDKMLKNDPMTTAEMILLEGPKNDREKEIHLMLRDVHAKGDENAVRQVLMQLPQGM